MQLSSIFNKWSETSLMLGWRVHPKMTALDAWVQRYAKNLKHPKKLAVFLGGFGN